MTAVARSRASADKCECVISPANEWQVERVNSTGGYSTGCSRGLSALGQVLILSASVPAQHDPAELRITPDMSGGVGESGAVPQSSWFLGAAPWAIFKAPM